jgi:hypothetical protein
MLARASAILTFALLITTSAYSTAAKTPKHPTPASCKEWAARQEIGSIDGEDVTYMWGQQEDGTSSREIALQRLTLFCLGHRPPEIIYFGSNNGFDEAYCRKHSRSKICKDVR